MHPWHSVPLGDDVHEWYHKELQRFFLDYKVLENKTVEIERLRGWVDAENVIRDSMRLYQKVIAPSVRTGS